MNRKKWRKLPAWKKSQIKSAIADQKMREMDRELSAICGTDFNSRVRLATMTTTEGFGKLTKLDGDTRKESPVGESPRTESNQ